MRISELARRAGVTTRPDGDLAGGATGGLTDTVG